MVQAADLRNGDHLTLGWWLYLPWEGSVPIQGEMRAGVVVVGNVVLEDAPKMRFSENDQVIDALASNRPDDSLSVRVGQSCQLHLMSTVHDRFGSPIRSIPFEVSRSGSSSRSRSGVRIE